MKELVPFGEYRALTKRKITEETCKKFGYFVGEFKEQTVQVAPYRNTDGEVIAQKVRFADKSFTTRGKFKGASNQISPSMSAHQSPPLPLPEPAPPA
ncbi:hypothetical protein QK899_12685 [Pseudomonas sp. AR5]|nr:hypothetical protein QK899_12685 [Pseudomonas sp. AR5]